MVLGLPSVPPLDPGGAVGGHSGRGSNHAGIAPDKLQMVDSTVIRAHHHAEGAKGGLRKRLLAIREVGSRPGSISASTARAPDEDRDHAGPELRPYRL